MPAALVAQRVVRPEPVSGGRSLRQLVVVVGVRNAVFHVVHDSAVRVCEVSTFGDSILFK